MKFLEGCKFQACHNTNGFGESLDFLEKIYGVGNSVRRCKTIKSFGCQIDEYSENEKQLFEHHHLGNTVLELTKEKCINMNLLQSFFLLGVHIQGFPCTFQTELHVSINPISLLNNFFPKGHFRYKTDYFD